MSRRLFGDNSRLAVGLAPSAVLHRIPRSGPRGEPGATGGVSASGGPGTALPGPLEWLADQSLAADIGGDWPKKRASSPGGRNASPPLTLNGSMRSRLPVGLLDSASVDAGPRRSRPGDPGSGCSSANAWLALCTGRSRDGLPGSRGLLVLGPDMPA